MYKLENGILVKAPKSVHRIIKGKEYFTTNASEEILRAEGYKPLEEQQKPEITQYQLLKEVLEDRSNVIVKRYEVLEKPIINDEVPELAEGYIYEDYENITPTEVHRGKRLISAERETEETVATFSENNAGQDDGGSDEGTSNGTEQMA